MKYFILLLGLMSFGFINQASSQEKYIFLGEINGQSAEIFKKNELSPQQSQLSSITASRYKIDIRLYEIDVLMSYTFCTVIYLDTVFKRKAFYLGSFMDTLAAPKELKIPSYNLDSLFNILVRNGVFSIQSLEPDDVRKDYNPKILTSHGIDSAYWGLVSDGTSYLLSYKVDTCFGQAIFSNPGSYSKIYPDYALPRRQSEIAAAIETGIEYRVH